MNGKKTIGRRIISWLVCVAMVLSLVPAMGSVAYAADEYVKLGDISEVQVTSDFVAPALGEANPYSGKYLSSTVISPLNQKVRLANGRWLKKDSEGEFKQYNNSVFEAGVYKLNVQLRTDAFDDGTYYALNDDVTLTVNDEEWTATGPKITDYYESNGFGYKWFDSKEYVVEPAPEKYSVTIEVEGNGNAGASVLQAESGEVVTLTATPKSLNVFKEWKVVSGGVTVVDDSFTMGNENVVIKAVFEKIPFEKIGDVSSVSATADIKPEIGEKNTSEVGYVKFTIDSPLNQNVGLVNGRWLKQDSEGEFSRYEKATFEPGTYKLNVQLRTDVFDDGTYYALNNDTTLTVNGEEWTPVGTEFADWYESYGYGLRWFDSKEYILCENHDYTDQPYINDGKTHYQICNVCGLESEHVACTEGTPVKENVVEPTYEIEGSHDEVIVCEICGQELSRSTVIDPVLEKSTETPTETPTEQKPTEEPTEEDTQASTEATTPVLADGTVKTVGKAKYMVVDSENKGVEFKATSATGSVVIPATVVIDEVEYSVTNIADNAFKNNKKITKVTIPASVKTIGKNTFYGCTKLKTVTFKSGSKLVGIGDKAFYKCSALTKITIPAKVAKVGKQAFYNCKKLKTVTIQSTKLKTSKVGSKAFSGINAKAKIKVPKSKLKTYKTLLKKKGITGKKQKITK